MKRVLVGACAAVCLLAPAASARTRILVPPGNSAISQYTEVVPAGGGGTPADRIPSGHAFQLPSAAARALRGSGATRSRLSSFVGATAPRGRASGTGARAGISLPGGSSSLGSLLHSAAGSGAGMGLWFPLLLVAALATAAAIAWQRRVRS